MTAERRDGGTADEGPFEEPLRTAAQQYHEPPPVPREEMWAVIAAHQNATRADATGTLPFRRRAVAPFRRPAFRLGAGIAALLVLGIGIGRFTAPGVDADTPRAGVAAAPAAGSADPSAAGSAYQLAAERHLEQSELYLTLFRTSARTGRTGDIGIETARELLMSNRLLLDSPASEDPRVRRLLEDLELVLAQIAQLPAASRDADADYITDGMEAGSVLPRLRSATSEGVAATLRQGAL
jgi:hypothetical protein